MTVASDMKRSEQQGNTRHASTIDRENLYLNKCGGENFEAVVQ
jgi:hypothetical protein